MHVYPAMIVLSFIKHLDATYMHMRVRQDLKHWLIWLPSPDDFSLTDKRQYQVSDFNCCCFSVLCTRHAIEVMMMRPLNQKTVGGVDACQQSYMIGK